MGKNFYLIIRDEQNRFVAGRGISIEDKRNYVNLEKGSIMVKLPSGVWQVELVSDLSDLDSVIASTGKFKVERNGKITPVKIVVRK